MDRKGKQAIIGTSVVILIIIVCVVAMIVKKNTPSKEVKDLTEYYEVKEDEILILLQNQIYEKKALLIDGAIYIDYDTVVEQFNKRFYWDVKENVLVYTTPTEIIKAEVGSKAFSVNKTEDSKDYAIVKTQGDAVYVALDFVKDYSNLEYQLVKNPNRLVVSYKWGEEFLYAEVKKDTQLRVEASIKSPILVQLKKGDRLTYVDTDEVSKNGFRTVMTSDGVIGFVKTKTLLESHYETLKNEYEAPEYTSIQKEGKINLAWHQVTNQSANNALLNMIEDTKGITTISPTWFSIASEEGDITSLASEKYVDRAHNQGLEVWALVNDFNVEIDTNNLFSYTSRREKLSNELLAAAIKYNLDGINIDFEKVAEKSAEGYIQFLRELSVKCRNNGLVLSVDNYVPSAYTEYFDRAEQGAIVDYVITMAYDEHFAGSEESGSVASIGFVETAVTDILKVVPKEKAIIALPFYTRVWKEETVDGKLEISSEAYSMDKALEFLVDNKVVPKWNEQSGQYFGQFESEGFTYKVWLEEDESFEKKLETVFTQEVAGVAGWKLGLEKDSIWDLIIKYVN